MLNLHSFGVPTALQPSVPPFRQDCDQEVAVSQRCIPASQRPMPSPLQVWLLTGLGAVGSHSSPMSLILLPQVTAGQMQVTSALQAGLRQTPLEQTRPAAQFIAGGAQGWLQVAAGQAQVASALQAGFRQTPPTQVNPATQLTPGPQGSSQLASLQLPQVPPQSNPASPQFCTPSLQVLQVVQ